MQLNMRTVIEGVVVGGLLLALGGLVVLRDMARDAYQIGLENRQELNARASTMAEITAEQPLIRSDLQALARHVNWLTEATSRIGHAIDPRLNLPPPPPIVTHTTRSARDFDK